MSKYNYKKSGNTNITTHFKVKEMKSPDSDTIVIDKTIVKYAEKLRTKLGATSAKVTSGYRTTAYNKKVGGSSNSPHLLGKAMDIVFYKNGKIISAKTVCLAAEKLSIPAIGYISKTAVHIDCKYKGSRFFETYSPYKYVTSFAKYWGVGTTTSTKYNLKRVLKKGKKGSDVRALQTKLGITKDSSFGSKTRTAVIKYQKSKKLSQDGKVGIKTAHKLGWLFKGK